MKFTMTDPKKKAKPEAPAWPPPEYGLPDLATLEWQSQPQTEMDRANDVLAEAAEAVAFRAEPATIKASVRAKPKTGRRRRDPNPQVFSAAPAEGAGIRPPPPAGRADGTDHQMGDA